MVITTGFSHEPLPNVYWRRLNILPLQKQNTLLTSRESDPISLALILWYKTVSNKAENPAILVHIFKMHFSTFPKMEMYFKMDLKLLLAQYF